MTLVDLGDRLRQWWNLNVQVVLCHAMLWPGMGACHSTNILPHTCKHRSLILMASHTTCLSLQPMRGAALQAAVAGCLPSAAPHAAALDAPAAPAPSAALPATQAPPAGASGGPAPPGAAAARGALAARTLFAWRLPASPHLAVQHEGATAALRPSRLAHGWPAVGKEVNLCHCLVKHAGRFGSYP
jgi:hypothetical protein